MKIEMVSYEQDDMESVLEAVQGAAEYGLPYSTVFGADGTVCVLLSDAPISVAQGVQTLVDVYNVPWTDNEFIGNGGPAIKA